MRLREFTLSTTLLVAAIFASPPQVTVVAKPAEGTEVRDIRSYFDSPRGIAVDSAGNVIFAAPNQNRVFEVKPSGELAVVAGNGMSGFGGDEGPATNARLASPAGVAVDGAGDLFIADTGNNRVRRVDGRTGIITTIAGDGSWGGPSGRPATRTGLWRPFALATDRQGNLYISDSWTAARLLDRATGMITNLLGGGVPGYPAAVNTLEGPFAVAVDNNGHLFIADPKNDRVFRYSIATGTTSIVAGNAIAAFGGDGQPASSASLSFPEGIAVDTAGNLYIADTGNNRIRRVDAKTGVIVTVAGYDRAGLGGDGAATQASLSGPTALAVNKSGDLFISDTGNNRILRVDAKTQVMTTIAGSNQQLR